jgi:putative acetyltransferase
LARRRQLRRISCFGHAMSLNIRITPPDHPQVLELIAELDNYLAKLYEPEANHILDVEALKHPSVTFLGAWDGDHVVACGAARVMPGEPATGGHAYGEIKRMFVKPIRRGERIAQRLLDALESELKRQGISRALLETGDAQSEALMLYGRCGYGVRDAFGGYPDNGLSVFMEKRWTTA